MTKFICVVAYLVEEEMQQELVLDTETDEPIFNDLKAVKDAADFFLGDYIYLPSDASAKIKWVGRQGFFKGASGSCIFNIISQF